MAGHLVKKRVEVIQDAGLFELGDSNMADHFVEMLVQRLAVSWN